ncbi:MAG: 7-carboxy-7-deazaguanine synthase QueE [Bacteroidales bacterium]|nr:7-carboxy-7-deazaguanine synthase QueE [Bacteroidales bacterium]
MKRTDRPAMRVNEIFCSVQGEGRYTGTPAVFLRFSGCNLKCHFCDTDHSSFTEMSEEEIVGIVAGFPSRHIVVTGGEPSLQLTSSFCRRLHEKGFFIQMETNGSFALPGDCQVDWITCSPKSAPVRIGHVDELKVVYWGQDVSCWEKFSASEHRLQPLDTKDEIKNKEILRRTLDYIMDNPLWSLSLQTHKIIDVR